MDEVLSRFQALELRAQQAEQAAATAQQQLLTAQTPCSSLLQEQVGPAAPQQQPGLH